MQNRMVLALMAEYKDVASVYNQIISDLATEQFLTVFDPDAKDPDCSSILTITEHLVSSGYAYINYINAKLEVAKFTYVSTISDTSSGVHELNAMLKFTEVSLEKILHLENEEIEHWRYDTSWGVLFDFEQIMEHAIVHIMRHRRQIQEFLSRN
jgi:hypothetical protein